MKQISLEELLKHEWDVDLSEIQDVLQEENEAHERLKDGTETDDSGE